MNDVSGSRVVRRLKGCPATFNCVNSQSGAGRKKAAPLPVDGDPAAAWKAARGAVEELGGAVDFDDGEYLHAVFTSALFRFKDDLELVMEAEERVIHVRSASRIGNYDFGVNRRRAKNLLRVYLRVR